MDEIADIKKKLIRKKSTPIPSKDFLSTGSTLLNLACSGRVSGGFAKGTYNLLVGDSASGKTMLALTTLAEASINPNFKNYRLIYNEPERGALMDKETFFGPKLAKRLETVCSPTLEAFYYHLDDLDKDGTPYIEILDSMDSLVPEEELNKFNKNKKAYNKGKEETGSYGTAKAKMNASRIRIVTNKIQKAGSIVIIIAQTRDNIGFTSKFNPKTRSGGTSLRFYATLEMWTSIREKIKRRVNEQMRQIGILMRVTVKKNRIQGTEWSVDIPIYDTAGVDDIGACVKFLVKEKHWKESKGIHAPEFKFVGNEEKLVQKIENEGLELELKSLVSDVWSSIQDECTVVRKRRYE